LGFELATLGDRVAFKLGGMSAKEIEGILQKELDRIFDQFKDQPKKGGRKSKKCKTGLSHFDGS
jgi:hypothetical protein